MPGTRVPGIIRSKNFPSALVFLRTPRLVSGGGGLNWGGGGQKTEISFVLPFLFGSVQKGYQGEVTQVSSTFMCRVPIDIYPTCTFLRYEVSLKNILEGLHFPSNPIHSKKVFYSKINWSCSHI